MNGHDSPVGDASRVIAPVAIVMAMATALMGANLGALEQVAERNLTRALERSEQPEVRGTVRRARRNVRRLKRLSPDRRIEVPPVVWTEQGVVLRPGEGWEAGGFVGEISPTDAVKFGSAIFLLYTAHSGPRRDGGPANRALGVATSGDGLMFERYAGGPVVTHQPSEGHPNREEEGVFSAAARVEGDTLHLWYTGIVAEGPDSVNANVLYTTSRDGFTFAPGRVVLDHADPSVWGSGDELFAHGVFRGPNGEWCLFYGANNGRGSFMLGIATGRAPDRFDGTGAVLPRSEVIGGGDPVGDLVPFVLTFATRTIRWYRLDPSELIRDTGVTSPLPGIQHVTVLLDDARFILYGLDDRRNVIKAFTSPAPVDRWARQLREAKRRVRRALRLNDDPRVERPLRRVRRLLEKL